MRRTLILSLTTLLLLTLFIACGEGGGTVGKPAVNFTAVGLDGKTYNLSDYKGQLIFLNYFASWCEPCRKEIPHMLKLAQEYKDQGFVLLFVTEDTAPALMQPMVDEFGITQPIMMAADDPYASNSEANSFYAHPAIPTTFIINPNFELVNVLVGAQTYETFRKELEANLP